MKRILSAAKRSGRMTALGHVKTLWCPFCKKEQDFVQTTEMLYLTDIF